MPSSLRPSIATILGSLAWAFASSVAQAQGLTAPLDDKVWLRVAAYQPTVESSVRVDRRGGNGTQLDAERDLGLDDRPLKPALLLGVRLAERWRLELEYFDLDRDHREVVFGDEGVDFGDGTFNASAVAQFDIRTARLSAGYSFLRTPQTEVGVVLGVHVTEYTLKLEGEAIVDGVSLPLFAERREGTVPAPTVGLYAAHAFADRWLLDGRVDLFDIDARGYDGHLLHVAANVQYRVASHFDIGLGWRYDDMKLQRTRGRSTIHVDYRFSGPQVFLNLGF